MSASNVSPISVPETTQVLDDLRRIVQALRESSREAELRLGVSGAQLFVLRALAAQREQLSLNDLAARTRTHQSTVSVVVKRLVDAGLVARATSADDARRQELSLTRRGRALLERAPHAAQERLVAGIERLPPAQRRALASSLHRLVAAMELDDAPADMFFEETPPPKRGKRHVAP